MKMHCNGISLLEIITTLAISGILLGMAVPFVGSLLAENRVAGQINALRGAIALTRSEAITRQHDVIICKSADQDICTKKGEWNQGYIVFTDKNRNRRRDSEETLIHVHGPLPDNMTLTHTAFGSKHYMRFQPTGFTWNNGTFVFCNLAAPKRAKALIIARLGRARLSDKDDEGGPLPCGPSG